MEAETTKLFLGLGYPTWGDILVFLGLAGAAYSWWSGRSKERELRSEEIQWRRTEFIFEQASLFDGDNDVSDAVKIITSNNVLVSVDDLLDLNSNLEPKNRGDDRHKLDKLLNLMERIAFAFQKGILTADELSHFEWYYLKVKEIKSLSNYCTKYYPAILNAANCLKSKPANQSLEDETPQSGAS